MVALTTISNISTQAIPVLVGKIDVAKANPSSQIPPTSGLQVTIVAGSQLVVESQRLDKGQIIQLANMKLITYSP